MIATITPNRFSDRKLTIIVSAKFFKKAAVRNFLKRRVRAVLQPLLKNLEKPLLVRLSSGADQAAFADLAEDLRKQIKQYLK